MEFSGMAAALIPVFQDELYAKFLAQTIERSDRDRSVFIERSNLSPPETMRIIDCKSTVQERTVVLIDRKEIRYTAISHTSGSDEVYRVFDCECSAKCLATVRRCSGAPCLGHTSDGDGHRKVVKDILKMCEILLDAGADYAWHDGVCIAQYDDDEVKETIAHMGWIYANAEETIIFLDSVGEPMGPIRHDGQLVSRWHTRVWTVQEAALSKRRRYCVRLGGDLRSDCQSSRELMEKIPQWCQEYCKNGEDFATAISQWYTEDSTITVIEEDAYWNLLFNLNVVIDSCIRVESASDSIKEKLGKWSKCVWEWWTTVQTICLEFPTLCLALRASSVRNCTYEIDRINSILTLSSVTDFVAPKDGNMEDSTIEFFKRQNHRDHRGLATGLATALFTTNEKWVGQHWHHTWVPSLSSPLTTVFGERTKAALADCIAELIKYEVQPDGTLQLKGLLVCVPVQFTLRERGTTQESRDRVVLGRLAMDLRLDSGETCFLASIGALEAGQAFIPFSSSCQPMVQGRGITLRESFYTHLVFPAQTLDLQLHERCLVARASYQSNLIAEADHLAQPLLKYAMGKQELHNRITDFSIPGLLVQGDLQGQVSKIGCFLLDQGFIGFLIKYPSIVNRSFIQNLIIT